MHVNLLDKNPICTNCQTRATVSIIKKNICTCGGGKFLCTFVNTNHFIYMPANTGTHFLNDPLKAICVLVDYVKSIL